MYEKIFTKGKIGGVEIRNRVILSPMEETLGQASGEITPRAIEYYANKAKGGCGLVIAGYISVMDSRLSGIGKSGQIHLWNLNDRRAMSVLAERVHEYGGKLFCQLHHPGRRGSSMYNDGNMIVSATAMPSKMHGRTELAHELTVDEIHEIEDAFANAAEHAFWAGADGVELHVGHFYLLHQFICPIRNERTDEYGGSIENRCRIVDEIIDKIRERTPNGFAITRRIHLFDNDGYEGELKVDDMIEITKHFEAHGVDAFNFSVGTANRTGSPDIQTGWRSEYLKGFKKELHVPIYGNNETRTPDEAEQMLEDGVFDFVLLGRAQSADPQWANKAKAGHPEDIRPCLSCNYCVYRVNAEDKQIRCAVNPLLGREIDNLMPLPKGEGTVIVIGAGPAGIQASMTLSERGYKVKLYDKRPELGGSMNLANKAPNKFRMENLRHYYIYQIEKDPNIEVHLNTEVTPALLDEFKALDPHAVVLACGGQPIVSRNIPGIEKGIASFDILTGKVKMSGKKVAVIGGGMTGLETAEKLADDGNEVIIVEMKPLLGDGIFVYNVNMTKKFLEERGAQFKTCTALKEVKDGSIVIEPYHGKFISAGLQGMRNISGYIDLKTTEDDGPSEIAVDVVVLSLGIRPDLSFMEELQKRFDKVVNIGDCTNPGRIGDATGAAYLAVKEL